MFIVFIVIYCMKLINDVIKGNHYGDNIECFIKFPRKTLLSNVILGCELHWCNWNQQLGLNGAE